MRIDWCEWLVDLPAAWNIGLRITAVLAMTWIVHSALARRNPRWRTLLWRLTAVGLVMIPLLVAAMPKTRFAVELSGEPSDTALGSSPLSDWHDPRPAAVDRNAAEAVSAVEKPGPLPAVDPSSDSLASAATDGPYWSSASGNLGWWALWACWGLGAGVPAFRWCAAQRRVRRNLAGCETAPEPCRRALDCIRARLGCSRPIGLRISAEADTPFLAGLFRPVVVLPARMAEPDNARELPAVFAHETAHHQSRDLIWMGLLNWVRILLWFHPLVWRISRAHSTACEEVADATAAEAVGGAAEYSRTLARVALLAVAPSPAAATIPMARSPEIVTRLARLRQGLRFPPLPRGSVLAAAALAALAVVTVAGVELVGAEPLGAELNSAAGNQTRTIEFPRDYCVGSVFFTSDRPVWQSRIEGIHYPATLIDVLNGPRRWNWSGHAKAQGKVTVPAGAKVKLLFHGRHGIRDMAWISRIGPDDLHTLEVLEPDFGDAQLAHLSRLTGLEELRLRKVRVSDRGLRFLATMKSLKALWLESAELSNAGLKYVGQLDSLEALAVVGGRWNDTGLAHLARLPSLREFYYSPSRVRGPGLEHIARLPSLRYVYGRGPEFTDRHLAAWSRAGSLKGLHIQLAKLTDEGLRHLENLGELEYLNLCHCGATSAGLVHLKPLKKLKQLQLSMPAQRDGTSMLTVRGLAQVAGLQSLERLDLPNVGMTDEHCEQVPRLKNLKFLRIGEYSESPIADAGLEHLARLENLECLFIGGAGITDDGLAHIASLPRLKHLHPVYVPHVTNGGFAKLSALKSLESLFMPYQSRATLSAVSQLNGLSNLRYLNCEPTKPPAPDDEAMDVSGMTRLEILILPSVRDEDLACLRAMKNLKELRLIQPPPGVATVGDRGVAHLAEVTSLKHLNIGSSALTDAGLVHLTAMRQLSNLILTGRFTDEAVAHLETLKGLKSLQIYDSKLSPEAKERLKQNLPNLVVLDDSGRPTPVPRRPVTSPNGDR